jgi:hypothetical protein
MKIPNSNFEEVIQKIKGSRENIPLDAETNITETTNANIPLDAETKKAIRNSFKTMSSILILAIDNKTII